MYLSFYMNLLGYNEMPYFLKKYLKSPILLRLKKVGYFCGMDYASKDIYDFREYISRYDHSITVALLTYRFTRVRKRLFQRYSMTVQHHVFRMLSTT